MDEHLLLKWGTLKGWKVESEVSRAALKRYVDHGMALGAAQQRDSEEQVAALCDLIDAIQGDVVNDWTGVVMSKDEAKTYVLNYGKKDAS